MLMRRDFDLNSVDADFGHVYSDSLKEVFRKTMLSQEIVFQNQVHELHRIYQMQRTLMQGDNWTEFDKYNLNNVNVIHSQSQELFYRLQQRPFGCESPANHYAGHVDHPDTSKLSLTVGESNERNQGGERTWFDLELAGDVIDIEESTETISNDDSGNAHSFGRAALTVISESKLEPQKSVLTELTIPSSLKKDQPSDLERCNCNASSEKQQISSYVTFDFDLNKVYCDDSSCHSNDLMTTNPSTGSSANAFRELFGSTEEGSSESQIGTKECNTSFNEASGFLHSNSAQTPVNAKENHERTETCARRLIFDENDSSDGIVSCTLEVSQSQIHTCSATEEANTETGKIEDDLVLYSDHSHIDSASPEPCHIGDNESSNADHVALLTEQNLRSERDEADVLVQEAAESLVQISFKSLACYGDCSATENKEIPSTPQCSYDSFERFTLGLKDCAEEDLCVSSKLAQVDLTENRDSGLKIRRGRRLKDFQKDILPGLASLSRHEIREDINILEGVLRSREYRKLQAKMGDNGQRIPARSRRPRVNCTKRRRFS